MARNKLRKEGSADVASREGIQSRKDFAEILILEDTAKEVDASKVDSMGFTKLDFDPLASLRRR